MKIAYLTSYSLLPENPERRADSFEHDFQVECLSAPLRNHGVELRVIRWNDPAVDWTGFAAVVIGTTWDYWDHHEAFLGTLDGIEALGVPVFNSAGTVRWNSRKTYLKQMAEAGVPCIPTLWMHNPRATELEQAFDSLGSDDLVVKRQVGAGAFDQIRIRRGDQLSDYPHDAMVQPFMRSIVEEGEYSFVMIDGEVSHALVKRARKGDYRIQAMYGGVEEKIEPSRRELEMARSILRSVSPMPLYARVDMIRGDDGSLILMELELIEPYLYPVQADRLGEMFCDALLRRLNA